MHVLASKGKWKKQFFRKHKESSVNDEPMADDESMDSNSSEPVPPKSLELSRKTEQPINKNKTRRGYGKKNKRKNKEKIINFSVLVQTQQDYHLRRKVFLVSLTNFNQVFLQYKKLNILKLEGLKYQDIKHLKKSEKIRAEEDYSQQSMKTLIQY